MQDISSEQKASLDILLIAATTLSPAQLQSQIRQQIYQLLTESDWQNITATAMDTVQPNLLNQVAAV
jgi:hypothetical protein